MRTIGRTHVVSGRDYATACDACGVTWLRSAMKRSANGGLLCPDDATGRVEAELDRGNASGTVPSRIHRGGPRQ